MDTLEQLIDMHLHLMALEDPDDGKAARAACRREAYNLYFRHFFAVVR